MLSFQKSASDRIGLEYDFSSSITTSTNTIVFVPPSNNVEIENNDVKTDLAKTKSLNRRSSISVTIVELLDILDLIAISG